MFKVVSVQYGLLVPLSFTMLFPSFFNCLPPSLLSVIFHCFARFPTLHGTELHLHQGGFPRSLPLGQPRVLHPGGGKAAPCRSAPRETERRAGSAAPRAGLELPTQYSIVPGHVGGWSQFEVAWLPPSGFRQPAGEAWVIPCGKEISLPPFLLRFSLCELCLLCFAYRCSWL